MDLNPRDEKLQIENEIIEIHSKESESTESLCSSCKLEVSNDNGKMNGVAAVLDSESEDLMQASQSLSQISVKDEEALDCNVNQETLFDLENSVKSSENKSTWKDDISSELVSLGKIKEYTPTTNDLIKDSTIEAERNCPFNPPDDDSDEDFDLFLRISSLHQDTQQPSTLQTEHQISEIDEPPTPKRMKLTNNNKIFSGKTTTNCKDSWDTDVLPATVELKMMDDSVRQLTQQNLKEFSSSNSKGDKQKGEISKIFEVNYNGITESAMQRKRTINDLVNDVYEASCYLDGVRKALAGGPTSGAVIIPPLPKSNGYDKQFDFPERRRYSKLPITIETVDGSKRDVSEKSSFSQRQSNSSSNLGKYRKSTPRKASINSATLLKPSSIKPLNNRIQIALPDRFKKQQSIKEMFSVGNKENKGMKNTNDNGVSTLCSGLTNNSFAKDNISDSGSMYEYNPLIHARKPTKQNQV